MALTPGPADESPPVQPQEQHRYAALLDWGTRLGFLVLVASFAAYVTGIADARVVPQSLPQLWTQPVDRYLELTGSPTGWGWLTQLHLGDMAGLLGIAILAGCSLPCLLALVPLYWRRGDRVFVGICLAQVLVLALAASGWLTGGH
jgi:hypothetical protein